MTQIRTWLDFALQQMAAESYIHRFLSGELGLEAVLKVGSNNLPGDQSDVDVLSGKTRMTTLQAQEFTQKYQIVDHHANDATGFSATLMFDTQTNSYTLSFRSTESAAAAEGGDRERDLLGADAEIGVSGFAFGQLVAMEHYYQSLKANGTLPTGAVLNVTGFSLGGHLATVFTELHADEVNHTYIFNGAGRGHVPGAVPGLAAEENRISDMLTYFRSVLDNPDNALASFPRTSVYDQAKALYDAQGSSWRPFDQGTASLYGDVRYQWAKAATQSLFGPTGLTFLQAPGEVLDHGAFTNITHLYGQATTDDVQFIANSGVHAPAIPVFIEGQPLIAGLPFPSFTESGNTHSITLIVDSLAVQELIQIIDPRYGQASAELLIKASSNAKADTVASLSASDAAEGDSLEKTVEAFRQLFLGPNTAFQPFPVDSTVGGFGNLAFRNQMYNAMAAIQQVVQAKQTQGTVFTIDDLTHPTVSTPVLAGIADTDTDQGLAYRYALKELNPFAIIADTPQANDALYQAHNEQGQLIRVNPIDGTGSLTAQYLTDRALFLKEKIALNQLDLEKSSGNIHFKDVTPDGSDITTVVDLREDREFLFGSDHPDILTGGNQADHLYGGGSVDVLIGNAGRDYLEGNGGGDRLEGGAGADMMAGGSGNDTYLVDDLGDQVIEVGDNGRDRVESSVTFSLVGTTVEELILTPSTGSEQINGVGNHLDNQIAGNNGINRLEGHGGTDHLIGNDGNDVLIGGTGDADLLEGGIGFDTYIYNAGDGLDRIEDSDAQGQIIFNGSRLLGGIHNPDDPLNTYTSLDGLTTYVLSGTDLIVNGVLIVNENFQSGQFGIDLRDVPEANWENDYPVVVDAESDGLINNILNYSDVDDLGFGERGNDQLFGNGGNDILRGWSGNDRLYGGTGDDVLDGDWRLILFDPSNPPFALGTDLYYGDDWVDGGEGNDTMYGSWGDDVLHGGTGNDLLYGDHALSDRFTSTADDFLDGGEGDDELHGMAGDDVLAGGDGNDTLLGHEDDDWMDGGDGADVLWAGVGHDSLSGGNGVDILLGDLGSDLLDGGSDADVLYGGDGGDELFGGAGNDLLLGDGLNTPDTVGVAGGNDFLDGGEGDDELQGMIGDDYLFGGTGHDLLLGQEGDDTLFGDDGNDQVGGGAGDDLLHGDAGDDVLDGHVGVDRLFGGGGHDGLAGGEGNDSLHGGAGNDTLQGDQGNDGLVGGAGHDVYNFRPGDGQDTITDATVGAEGNLLNFSGGITLQSLTFVHDPLQQMLTIQVGGEADSIRLLGFDPNTFQYVVETLRFSDGSFVSLADQLPLPGGLVEGTDEANLIRTGSGDDTVFAGAGDDVVHAGGGNDLLVGGGGADTLQGGAGQDRYVFNTGDGADTIVDMAGEGNRLVFGAGLSPSAIRLGKGENQSLDVQSGFSSDRVRLSGGLRPGETPIAMFEFADGTVLSFDQLLARGILISGSSGADSIGGTPYIDRMTGEGGHDVLFGEEGADQISGGDGSDVLMGGEGNDMLMGDAGNDTLDGEAGDDVLAGGSGDDTLYGGTGSDQYRYNLGDGLDTIIEIDPSSAVDTVVFGSGIVADDARLSVLDGGLVVRVGTGPEGVRLGTVSLADMLASQGIDLFRFADGTILTYGDLIGRGIDVVGTPFDDALFGTNLGDRFVGGPGNDSLQGGAGDDTYYFNAGDGQDFIDDVTERLSPDAGDGGGEGEDDDDDEGGGEGGGAGWGMVTTETNRVVFGAGIASEAVTLDIRTSPFDSSASQLVVKTGTGTDELVFSAFDRHNVTGPHAITEFVFADGTILIYPQLLARGFDLTGTDQHDTILGTNLTDRIAGGAGDDLVKSGLGDDGLDGGAGNDELVGGQGNDVYQFGFGADHDSILDVQGTADVVRLASGVSPSDVTVQRVGQDLELVLTGGQDRLTIGLYFLAPLFHVEQVQFAAGTIWDRALLEHLASNPVHGTEDGDVILGTAGGDRLFGFGGDDLLTGLAGDDVLDGGSGADLHRGGAGDDTYVVDDVGDQVIESAHEGTDVVQAAIGYQLPAHVEHLLLIGTAAVNGIGNELDNILTGNSAANMLIGGAGNDTYVVGVGDTIIESAGEGRDTVVSDVSMTLGADVEHLTLTGNQPINGTGNRLDNVLIGNQGINILAGGAGNDTYVVGFGDIVVERSGEGLDTIQSAISAQLSANVEHLMLTGSAAVGGIGNALENDLMGNAASNQLEGREGADRLDGAGGDDTLLGGSGQDVYLFGRDAGQDVIDDVVAGERDTIQLGSGIAPSDMRVALNEASELFLEIRGSNDRLTLRRYAPLNPDDQATKEIRFADGTIWDGAMLASRIESPSVPNLGRFLGGTENPDVLVGTDNDDTFEGLAGNDTLDGLGGNDLLKGYVGNDVLLGGDGHDRLHGESAWIGTPTDVDDILYGGAGNDLLYGEIGNDLLDGGSGNDWLEGGEGTDTYIFGRGYGTDQVIAFGGEDRIVLSPDVSPANVIVSGGGGALVLRISGTSDQLFVPLHPRDPFHRIGYVEFSDGTVWTQAMLLEMTRTVRGTEHADTLFGAMRAETFVGGTGDDRYVDVESTDTVIELAAEGIDTIDTSLNYTLPEHFENLTLQSSARVGTGNHAANVIIGTGADNVLDGRAGNDRIIGGGVLVDESGAVHGDGSDVLIGGEGDDVLIPSLGLREDGRNYLGQDVFGDDILLGGIGDDTYVLYNNDVMGEAGAGLIARATVVESSGEGSDTVIAASDYALGDHVENLALVGDGSVTLRGTGNADGNVLVGHAGVNRLEGLGGSDTLVGSGADDTLIGGAGNDTYLFNTGDGTDMIEDVAAVGEGNRIQFGTGITRSNLNFIQDDAARTLTINVGTSGTDQLVLTNFDPTGVNGSLVIETLAFADSSTASLVSLLGGPVNQAPTVAAPLADQTVLEDAPLSIQIPINTFVDQDAHDVLVYSARLADGTALPAWLTFDSVTHTFGGTPTNSEVGTLNLAVTATDLGGLSATSSFALIVQNVNDAPTMAMPLADQSTTQGGLFTFMVPDDSFVDVDAGDTFTYHATRADGTALPTWLTFNPSIRMFSGTPQGPDIGTIDVRVTATDSGTLSVSDVFALTILPILGTEGNDILIGAGGDDIIQGLTGDDVLQGLAGNDLLDGGAGIDSMAGGLGDDIFIVDTVGDVVTEGLNQGMDTVQSSITHALGVNVENLVLTGTGVVSGTGNSLNNSLTGNSANNMLNGGGGADTMIGGQGNDIYVVDNVGDVVTELENEGIDTVQTGRTHTLGANLENLTLTGSAMIDGTGNLSDNTLRGNSAANVLTGGAGNDMYVVGTGDTVVEQLNEGVDTVQTAVTWTLAANVEHLTLTGTAAINGTGNSTDNVLIGNSAANVLDADNGDDTVNGGAGVDILIGGMGNDTYIVDNVGDVVTENLDEGIDLVQSSASYLLSANVENLLLTGTGAISATGNSLNNMLTGNSGANILDGAAGADTMIGGTGNDTYLVDDPGDVVIEMANQGIDTVQSAITHVLGTEVENLTLIESTATNGTGNSLNNILTGNNAANTLTGLDGHDRLDGGAGADTLVGGIGNDIYVVDTQDDIVTENLNEGTDLVQSTVSYILTANVEQLTLTGIIATNGIGNALNNRLTGNSAANVLTGGTGNDTYVVSAEDTVIEFANEGTDTVQSDVSWTLGANLEHLTLTGTTAIDGTGNTLNNRLTGNNADNQLAGGAGNDTMRGGLGNDTYLIDRGEGRDVIIENDGIFGNSDRLQYGATINPLDLVISRQVNDLRLAVHGAADQVTIRDWYVSTNHQIERVQAGNGTLLLSTQVDQLIQAMASFSQQSGLTWDQAIDQRPQDVQAILAANWQ